MIYRVCGLVADILAKSTIVSRVGRCSPVVFVMEMKLFVLLDWARGQNANERMMMKLKKLLLFTG